MGAENLHFGEVSDKFAVELLKQFSFIQNKFIMTNFTLKSIGATAAILLTSGTASADWGTAENAGVLLDNSEMYDAATARTSDGGMYVIWPDAITRDGYMTFNLYGQYLDPQGNKMWGDEGKLIDSHMTPSWFSYWNIQVTPEDDVVISWADSRTQESGAPLGEGETYEAQVPVLYKITRSGEMLWGDEGVALDATKYMYPVQLMPVGATLYAKCISADDYGPMELQMLDEFGEFVWPEGKKFGGQIIASEGADFIGVYAGSEGVEAMRYNKDMEPQWEKPAFVSDRVFGGYDLNPYTLKTDGKGGVILSYLVELGQFSHIPLLGYVTANGETVFCEQYVDTEDGDHLYGVFGVNTRTEEIMAMWQMNMGFGVLQAEKYDYFGERMWGELGANMAYKEEESGYSYGPIAVEPLEDNKWLICYADEIGWAQNQLYLARVDGNGSVEWRLPMGGVGDVQNIHMYKFGNDIELIWSCIGTEYDDDWNETRYGKIMGIRTNIENVGINDISTDEADGTEAIYNLNGMRLDKLVKGFNIVRKANGETVKIINK